jgi:serine protease Do
MEKQKLDIFTSPEKTSFSKKNSNAKILVSVFFVSLLTSSVVVFLTLFIFTNLSQEDLSQDRNSGITETVRVTEEESAVIEAVQKAKPAVVSIIVTKDLSKIYEEYNNNFFSPFFFAPPTGGNDQSQEIGGGTGFFISADGLLLTNKHVVSDDAAEYSVITHDGTRYDNVKVLARDPIEDMAILKVEGENFPTLELGDSESLQVGQTVIAIGNSLGQYQNTVTKGIVSGLGRNITAGGFGRSSEKLQDIIQTDAAINQGNSGGPLINLSGQVVGINTAIDASGQLVGFALPINELKDEIESVRIGGQIVKPYLGVRYVLLNKQIATANNLAYDYGALILRGQEVAALAVIPGSPADKAGLRENDIILEINGTKITEDYDLMTAIQKYSVGDMISLKVFQKDKEKEIQVKLEERSN